MSPSRPPRLRQCKSVRRVPLPPPLPAEQQGWVSVGAFDDIGAVDQRAWPAVAAEFPDAVTARPQLQQELVIAYPEDALRERRRMTVGVLVIVDEQGKVERTAKSFDDWSSRPPSTPR